MKLICYPLLSEKSKKAICRVKKRFGKRYRYVPRKPLIMRLSKQLNMTPDQIRLQLMEERAFLIKFPQYYP